MTNLSELDNATEIVEMKREQLKELLKYIEKLEAELVKKGGRFFVSRVLYDNTRAENEKLKADISNLEFALEYGYAKPKGGKK